MREPLFVTGLSLVVYAPPELLSLVLTAALAVVISNDVFAWFERRSARG